MLSQSSRFVAKSTRTEEEVSISGFAAICSIQLFSMPADFGNGRDEMVRNVLFHIVNFVF